MLAGGVGASREKQQVVAAFLTAARTGDFRALLTVLAPEAVLRADPAAVQLGAAAETRGAQEVATFFAGRAAAARLALVDGVPGAVWAVGGQPRVVFRLTIAGQAISAIDLVGDPGELRELDIRLPARPGRPVSGRLTGPPSLR